MHWMKKHLPFTVTDTRFKKQQRDQKVTFDEESDTKHADAVVML
jgi:hypothetical protein